MDTGVALLENVLIWMKWIDMNVMQTLDDFIDVTNEYLILNIFYNVNYRIVV